MYQFFMTHFGGVNQIDKVYAKHELFYIVIILLLLSLFTIHKRQFMENDFLSRDSGNTLRGIAILLLILGHLSLKCIAGNQFFEYAGKWAVIIFLYISGIALVKTYGLDNLGNMFLLKRVKRLLFSTWIALGAFYFLDFILINKVYSIKQILISILCILHPGPPDGPAWFITYIFFLYLLYFMASKIRTESYMKIFCILLLLYVSFLCIAYIRLVNDYFFIWLQYSIVFPVSIAIGLYRKKIINFFSKIRHFRLLSIFLSIILFYQYYNEVGVYRLKSLVPYWIYSEFIVTLQPISLIALLLFVTYLLDKSLIKSKFLDFLGNYSFELFLIHMPFMVYYDFFLFRKPLVLWFFVYLIFICIFSIIFKILSSKLNDVFARAVQKISLTRRFI